MTKNVKLLVFVSLAIIAIVILFNIIKIFKNFFNVFERAKTVNKEYVLSGKEILLIDRNNLQQTLHFKDSTTFVLHFWATWCKPCIEKFDSIEKYHKSWKNVEIALITLESNEKMRSFLRNKRWNLPFYSTDSLNLPFEPKKIEMYPSDFIIRKDSLMQVSIGSVQWKNAFK